MGKRIGILTGGGDCPGLNAVIRAVVKTAANEYGWQVFGIEDGFEGLVSPRKVRRLADEDIRGILQRGGTILGTVNRGNPFARRVERDGQVMVYDASSEAIERMAELELDDLIVVGGDGTLRIAKELCDLGAPIVGVPKTIDNDLMATDVTFGFDTAVTTASEAIDKIHTTAESHHRVMVVEVMGRNAGWIALHSGLAGGADAILIPEIPFDIGSVCEKIHRRDRMGRKFSIVVVAEGAIPAGGRQVFQDEGLDGGMPRLGGIGYVVAKEIMKLSGHEARTTVLGYLQRGGSPTAFDRILGTRFGVEAVHAIAKGKLNTMVALKGTDVVTVPLAQAVAQPKLVPQDSQLIEAARGVGVVFG